MPIFHSGAVSISIAGFAVSSASLMVAWFTYWQRNAEGARSIRQQLTDTITKLSNTHQEIDRVRQDSHTSLEDFQAAPYIKDQGLILVQQAAFLANKILPMVTDLECALIGHAFRDQADYLQCDHWYAKAIAKATPRYRGWHVRSHARSLFLRGDYPAGRQQFTDALASFSDTADAVVQDKLDTYREWAWAEFEAGNKSQAIELLAKADDTTNEFKQWSKQPRLAWTAKMRAAMQQN